MTAIQLRSLRLGGFAATVSIALATSGCANLYLHSDTRQHQAEAASKAWTDVETSTLFTTERENLDKLAEAEQQTQVHVAAAIRDYMAAAIVNPGREGEASGAREKRTLQGTVLKPARAQFESLVGPFDSYDQRIQAADKLLPSQRSIEGLVARLQDIGSPTSDCPNATDPPAPDAPTQTWLDTLSAGARAGAKDDLKTLAEDCKTLLNLIAEQKAAGVDAAPVGQLKAAVGQLERDRRDVTSQRTVFLRAKARYDAALKAHAEAVAAAAGAPADVGATVAAKAALLKQAIDQLRLLQNAFAREFVAAETIDSIDVSLSAIAAGKEDDDSSKGVVFAIQAPALIDRYRTALAEARKPLVLPLLIRRNAEQLQRAAAAADVKLTEAKVEVSTRIVAAVLAQAAALRRATRELDDAAGPNAAVLDQPWADAMASTRGRQKQLLLSGTARYLDAASRLQGERYRLEYARIALDHQRGLAYAEASVAQWANLIGAGVSQLDTFAKGGIDKTVLSDLAKVLGLFWIGNGVNK